MTDLHDYTALLRPAIDEARRGMADGNMPCGGAIFAADGTLIASGHNTALTDHDPLLHGETAAFRAASFQADGPKTGMTFVTTLSPCWYCAGLIRWFGFERLVIGDSRNFQVAEAWLQEAGIEVISLNDPEAVSLISGFIAARPEEWAWPDSRLGETPAA